MSYYAIIDHVFDQYDLNLVEVVRSERLQGEIINIVADYTDGDPDEIALALDNYIENFIDHVIDDVRVTIH